jgi:hypothetical protein
MSKYRKVNLETFDYTNTEISSLGVARCRATPITKNRATPITKNRATPIRKNRATPIKKIARHSAFCHSTWKRGTISRIPTSSKWKEKSHSLPQKMSLYEFWASTIHMYMWMVPKQGCQMVYQTISNLQMKSSIWYRTKCCGEINTR